MQYNASCVAMCVVCGRAHALVVTSCVQIQQALSVEQKKGARNKSTLIF